MRVFNRRASIPFVHTFYDSTGGITSPSSARLTLSYCSSGFPFRGCRESTYVTLTQNADTLAYEGTWASTGAFPGTVFWSIEADDLTLAVETGQFELRGNPANIAATT